MAIFRHNRIRRLKIGDFEFRDHICRVEDKDVPRFMKQLEATLATAPRLVNGIKEINEEALKAMEKDVVVGRGRIGGLTAADSPQRIAAQASAVSDERAMREAMKQQARELESQEAAQTPEGEKASEERVPEETESEVEVDAESSTQPKPKPKPAVNMAGLKATAAKMDSEK